ncbi:MAG: multicopper oxidase domain-containing protein [Betaproteobacteria bacterium]|nr:multicopper oxidase domain-containing protein [Betaproteobacteria bacterium]
MNHLTRRKFLAALAGAAGLGELSLRQSVFAAMDAGHKTAPVSGAPAESAGHFINRLHIPGASGLYAGVPAKDVKQITVSELNFEVLPKVPSAFWAYVAEVGGKRFLNPTLLARPGDQINLRMVNRLKQPTIIHWHGMTNDERNDGAGMYQVAPGKNFDYAFTVRDRAANYWYHPHPHEIAGEQAYRGLAGLLIVKDDDDDKLSHALDLATGVTDIPLVIQDRSFNFEGKLEYKLPRDQLSAGFLGEEILVNLSARPYFDAARRVYRFRILNGSNARGYRLAFAQGSRPIEYYLIGTDGGLLEQPQKVRETFIGAAQRLDVLLDLREASGSEPVFLKSLAFDPMHNESVDEKSGKPAAGAMQGMSAMQGMQSGGADPHAAHTGGGLMDGMEMPLLQINIRSSPEYKRNIPSQLSRLPKLAAAAGEPRRLTLGHDGKGNWNINGWRFNMHETPVTVRRGTREIWLLQNNRASMPHPMHIHGFQFRVLERRDSPAQVKALATRQNGLLPQDFGLLDTVLVWPGESVRIALDFSHPFEGDQTYMFHCHNLEHEDTGMMIGYKVKA